MTILSLWPELTRRNKMFMLGVWGIGLVLSLCMLFIGQKIRFWGDHTTDLRTHPLLVCLDVLPWLLLFGLLSWTRVYLSASTASQFETHLHDRLMYRVLATFPPPENILNRFVTDIPAIVDAMTHQMAMGVRHVFFCALSFVMMWMTSPILTLCIISATPLIVIPFIWQLSRLKQSQKAVHHERDRLTRYVEECTANLTTIQAFSQEDGALQKWRFILQGLNQHSIQHGMQRAQVAWWVITSASMGVFGIIMTGAQYISLTTGDMMSFIFYAVLCISGLTAINNTYRELVIIGLNAERLQNILAQPIKSTTEQRHFPSTSRGMLACHHVHFAYPNHSAHEVLRGLTFSVTPGELVALVGKSGAGKSTLFSLILRFYAPQRGTIHLDGMDIQKVNIKDLRQRIGYVEQEPVLFDGTIYDNIIYGKPNATNKDVYTAMEESGVASFLEAWPKQEHTKIQDIALSGGQKQCVALARALIRKPSLFLLDEPTNALDAGHEALIQQAFKRVAQKHTTLMIAHRLSTVMQANKIVVLQDGVAQAIGAHNELIRQNNLYQSFVNQQLPHMQVDKSKNSSL